MKRPVVHIVGAGVSGLATAVHLVGAACDIVVHEAAPIAGGRRRSFFDEALGLTLDSGAFPLLGSHQSALAVIATVGAEGEWRRAASPGVDFVDMASAQRWRLAPNRGRAPWWPLVASRRAPMTRPADYWAARRLRSAAAKASVAEVAAAAGVTAMTRLWRPLCLAALNAEPERASARLAGAALDDILRLGGEGARIHLPASGFGRAFVEPALRFLRRNEVAVRFERRLKAIESEGGRVVALEFEHDRVDLGPGDAVALATPAPVAASLAPDVIAPAVYSAAITAHFAAAPRDPQAPALLGVVNGAFDWLFAYPDRLSATLLDAGDQLEAPPEAIAVACWRDVAALTGHSDAVPPWRVTRQRRARVAASPEEEARRPPAATSFRNLFLAGGYVATGAPDGLESAARSGREAARLARAFVGSGPRDERVSAPASGRAIARSR